MISRTRYSAAFSNLIISTIVVGSICWVTWNFWYPGPYFEIAGGKRIVLLLLSVNLVLGPVATFAVSGIKKPAQVLRNDLLLLLALQIGAVIYGVSVAAEARPVALVFAKDRFTLISANEVRLAELRRLKGDPVSLPWQGGPKLLSIRDSAGSEVLDAVTLASNGFDLPTRPSYWRNYDQFAKEAFQKARSIAKLIAHYKLDPKDFEAKFVKSRSGLERTVFLPLESKSGSWVVLLDSDGGITGFAPFDGFF